MDTPREKFFNTKDPKSLQTEELLAILLGHGTAKKDVFSLSKDITAFIRSKRNGYLTIEDLMQFEGVGKVKAIQILAALELGMRFQNTFSPRIFSKMDWSFNDLSQSERQNGVHFFHPYPAKFIPQIPSRIIKCIAKKGDIIVDPFMGSGTTLVESKKSGFTSFGFDTNPLAVQIAKAKTMNINEGLVKEIDCFLSWLRKRKNEVLIRPKEMVGPILFEDSDIWFRSDVEYSIRIILDEISSFTVDTQNFLKVGLSSILKGISNARMDYIIPTLPKEAIYVDRKHYYREVDNNSRYIPVFQRLFSQINRMKTAILEFNKETSPNVKSNALLNDARTMSKCIQRCNLIITSPPYWTAQNYEENQKLSLKLFGLQTLPGAEIGREKNQYLQDMELVFIEIAKILQGYFAIVIGEDVQNGMHELMFSKIINCGFFHVDTVSRRISNQTSRSKQITNEYIYLFKN